MCSKLPKVAVLLAAYNGCSWIEEQLSSILEQKDVSVSVYISVDPSTDGTLEWCVEYASTRPRVVILPPGAPCQGASRNFFRLIRDVDFSAYDHVAFSDQDDIWYPDKLKRAVARLGAGDVDGYSSNVVAFWPDGRRMLVDKSQEQVTWDFLFEAAGPGCTYVLTAKLAFAFKDLLLRKWIEVQQIDLHDWFCYAFARSRGYNWYIDPAPGMDYRQHDSNQIGVNSGMQSAIARWRQISNGWWFAQVGKTARLLEISNPFVKGESGLINVPSTLKLAFNATRCRRRQRDKLVLFMVCLVKAVMGHSGRGREG